MLSQEHAFIRHAIEQRVGQGSKNQGANYLGSSDINLGLKMGELRGVSSAFHKAFGEIEFGPFIDLLSTLYKSQLFEEKIVASLLLATFKQHRAALAPAQLDVWLNTLEGWAAIDNLCQSMFDKKLINAQWPAFKKALRAFSKSKNISKRRASLVLLLKTFREGGDDKHVVFNLKTLDLLIDERDILITKAVSWSLRTMCKHHAGDVQMYLDSRSDRLPAIALRETKRKLATGKK